MGSYFSLIGKQNNYGNNVSTQHKLSIAIKAQGAGQPGQSQQLTDRLLPQNSTASPSINFVKSYDIPASAIVPNGFNIQGQSTMNTTTNFVDSPNNTRNMPKNSIFGGPASPTNGSDSINYFQEPDNAFEWEMQQHEFEKIKKEIDELLKGKEDIEKIEPTNVQTNLKQVLKSLEGTKRQNNIIVDDSDDSDEEQMDLQKIIDKLMVAFNGAQRKTFQKVLEYIAAKKATGDDKSLFARDMGTMVYIKLWFYIIIYSRILK